MTSKICLITGGNSGIGYEAAIKFARQGFTVIIGCRNKNRGIEAEKQIRKETNSDSIFHLEIDMSVQQSIKRAANVVRNKFDCIDILIHNAADFDISRKAPMFTIEDIESVWATNHIGPVLLTRLMHDLLEKSKQGRIITVASKGLMLHEKLKINHNDPEFRNSGYSVKKAYYQSKLAQVMYTYWLSEDLKNSAITVNCIRVTNVKIDINRYPNISRLMKWLYSIKSKFSITPTRMADAYHYLATNPDLIGISGKYFDENNNQVKSSRYSYNKDEIYKVKATTERFIKGTS